MSLDRKDVRVKLDPEIHAGLTVLASVGDKDIAELAEEIVVAEVLKRIHAATLIAQQAARLGLSGNGRESAGIAGNLRD